MESETAGHERHAADVLIKWDALTPHQRMGVHERLYAYLGTERPRTETVCIPITDDALCARRPWKASEAPTFATLKRAEFRLMRPHMKYVLYDIY